MTLFGRRSSRSPLLLFVAAVALSQGCVLTHDFASGSKSQTQPDAGADAAADGGAHDSGAQDTGEQDAGSDASDAGADATDSGPSYTVGPINSDPRHCATEVPAFRVGADQFGDAADYLFAAGSTTQFDLGPPAASAFSNQQKATTHAVGVASATSDNKLAVGWASVDTADFQAGAGQPVITPPPSSAAARSSRSTGRSAGRPCRCSAWRPSRRRAARKPLTTASSRCTTSWWRPTPGYTPATSTATRRATSCKTSTPACALDSTINNALEAADITPARTIRWLPFDRLAAQVRHRRRGRAQPGQGGAVHADYSSFSGPRSPPSAWATGGHATGRRRVLGLQLALGGRTTPTKSRWCTCLTTPTAPPGRWSWPTTPAPHHRAPIRRARRPTPSPCPTRWTRRPALAFAYRLTGTQTTTRHHRGLRVAGQRPRTGRLWRRQPLAATIGCNMTPPTPTTCGRLPQAGRRWWPWPTATTTQSWRWAIGSERPLREFGGGRGHPHAHQLHGIDEVTLDVSWEFGAVLTRLRQPLPPARPAGLLAASGSAGSGQRELYVVDMPDVRDAHALCQ